jgi:polysaccharide biosynthesis PFTS motif protein
MVFYNPPKKLDSDKKYDVVIFDVTPQNSKSVFKDTIYSFPIAKEFIEDIIESVKLVSQKLDRNIGVYIKHKRNFVPTHSSKYISYIDELAKNRQLSVLPLDSDLYETIATSKIVIGFPFTSPVIIGQELKVPSIYYSSANTLVKYNQANFIQSKLELRKYIETNFGK